MKKYSAVLAGLYASLSFAAVTARDDAGQNVTLPAPAQRVVTLAPHATELVFAAGAGAHIVGTVAYSDYPPAARQIPQVGDYENIDIERIAAMKPDLVIVWWHGNTEQQIARLRQLGIPLFNSEPHRLDDIADNVDRLGVLLGTGPAASASAKDLRKKLADLTRQYASRPPVRVFYQVWDQPLFTLNGKHIVSDALRVCGGQNIFAGMDVLAPSVSVEAVLQANPDAIVGGDQREQSTGGINMWKAYKTMLAVQHGNLFSINSDLLSRAGPRMIAGTAALCEKLELARQHGKNPPTASTIKK